MLDPIVEDAQLEAALEEQAAHARAVIGGTVPLPAAGTLVGSGGGAGDGPVHSGVFASVAKPVNPRLRRRGLAPAAG